MRGLQGYQVNFPREQYAAMRTIMICQLGPPTQTRRERADPAADDAAVAGVLEWRGERTIATMKEAGTTGQSSHFAIVTRACLDLIDRERAVAESWYRERSTPARVKRRVVSVVPRGPEDFVWARNP